MDYSLWHTIWTLVALATFIWIVIWAWSGKRKQAFDKAAMLPLEEDDDLPGANDLPAPKEQNHG